MTDREKIRAEIYSLQDMTMDADGNFNSSYDTGRYDALCSLDAFIDSLPEESTSKDLEEAWRAAYEKEKDEILVVYDHHAGFVAGADWKEQQMMKGAFIFERKHNIACVLASECLRNNGWFNRERDFNDLLRHISCVSKLFEGEFNGTTKLIAIKEDNQ